jgi:hypothetical protein
LMRNAAALDSLGARCEPLATNAGVEPPRLRQARLLTPARALDSRRSRSRQEVGRK